MMGSGFVVVQILFRILLVSSAISYLFGNPDTSEVEKLIHEYPQNKDLIRSLGVSYYQIIYPTQFRRHEKMGISTREATPTKMGKHYHRTSLAIKAFSHKFRLDLELNTQLLAPNLVQKHYLPHGAEQVSKQEIEHCYYHGTVKDIPGAVAALHTCNGISGIIHIGNETFVIHPFYGGDLDRHPHVIFESHTKENFGCANIGSNDWRMRNTNRKQRSIERSKRDVREATKFIETALFVDRSMFEKRNGSTRAMIIQDALQIANIVDLYFRTINTRVSVVYIETWQGANQISIDRNSGIKRSLLNFNDYVTRQLFNVDRDTAQLLTGEYFANNEAGMAVPESICTPKSTAIVVDLNPYEPHLTAASMAHMIGHNIGMRHDDGRNECFCHDWHGCIMRQSIVGQNKIHPYKFSECSLNDYIAQFRESRSMCLLNKPNEISSPLQHCGNQIVEENEDCDCGSLENCEEVDPCCDHITCKLKKESECSASHECCSNCRFLPQGTLCRVATNECDIPEYCRGTDPQCPPDSYKKNGKPCAKNQGICFNGFCPTLSHQCEYIWGEGGSAADEKCYDQFNAKGSINGNCGMNKDGNYIPCEPENVLCGSLQCVNGSQHPDTSLGHEYTRTIISIKGFEYECKSTRNKGNSSLLKGLVRDGTPCGKNLICMNQTCTSVYPHTDLGKCPSNHLNLECSNRGVCSNLNTCYCDEGWAGTDCSIRLEILPTTPPPIIHVLTTPLSNISEPTKSNIESLMKKKETTYGNKGGQTQGLSTLAMVIILTIAVKGVFLCFALMAVCYRRTTMPKIKYDSPYETNRKGKSESVQLDEEEDIVVEMPGGSGLAYPPETPSCSQRPGSSASSESHRVFYRPSSQQGAGPSGLVNLNQEFNMEHYRKGERSMMDDETLSGHHHHHLHHHHHHPSQHIHQESDEDEEDDDESGPIRIRNLEDLIRQLEHHSSKQSNVAGMGSEDIRYSETEADHHYRVQIPAGNEELRFVFGRFRQPSRTMSSSYNPSEEERSFQTADHVRGHHNVGDMQADNDSSGYMEHRRPLGRSASEELGPMMQTPRGGSRRESPGPTVALFANADVEYRRTSCASLHRNVSVDECSSRDTIESSGNENSALLRCAVKYPEYKH